MDGASGCNGGEAPNDADGGPGLPGQQGAANVLALQNITLSGQSSTWPPAPFNAQYPTIATIHADGGNGGLGGMSGASGLNLPPAAPAAVLAAR